MDQLQSSSSSSATKYALLNCEAPGSRRKVALVAPKTLCPDEDSLPTVKAQLDYFAQGNSFELIELFEGKDRNEVPHLLYPIEIMALLGRDEFDIRKNQEKGLNPERHEPVYTRAAMEEALKKRRIPSEVLTHPESLVENTASTGSAHLFNLLLENGVKPSFGKTQETLKTFWKECVQESQTYIKKYWEDTAQNNLPQWPLEGIQACTGNILTHLKNMDFSLRTYAKVHAFIDKLRNRVSESRQEKLLAELEAEANAPKKLSKSAKRKARQKALREQQAAIQPSSPPIASTASAGVNQNPLPPRSVSPAGETVSGGSPSLSMPDDAVIRELREKAWRLLPMQTDKDAFRARVQSLKNRMERIEDRFEALQAWYSNTTEP